MSPAVLLIHAFPCDHRLWAAQVESLDGWRVLAPDLPGFGGTELLDAEPSLPAVADWLLGLLRREGIDRLAVGGISLGGYLVMELLRREPELFAAVLLCDTKASADSPEAAANRERLAAAVTAEPQACGRILRQSVLPSLLGRTSLDSRPEVVGMVAGWLDEAPAASVAWYQRAMAKRPDSLEVLSQVDVPALVLWGDEDALSPEGEQRSMLSALPRGSAAVIEGAGHLAPVERPEAASRAISDFLAQMRAPFTDL